MKIVINPKIYPSNPDKINFTLQYETLWALSKSQALKAGFTIFNYEDFKLTLEMNTRHISEVINAYFLLIGSVMKSEYAKDFYLLNDVTSTDSLDVSVFIDKNNELTLIGTVPYVHEHDLVFFENIGCPDGVYEVFKCSICSEQKQRKIPFFK